LTTLHNVEFDVAPQRVLGASNNIFLQDASTAFVRGNANGA
jgi:hypothetical protein